LFVEHYVDVPEDKYDVMDELANRLDEMEAKLDSEVSKNMEITEELDSLKRGNIVRQAGEDLTESQKEKLESLAEGVDFKDAEDFQEKISEIKEAYFPAGGSEKIAEETVVEEGTGEFSSDEETFTTPEMKQYLSAINKLKPLG
jgi:tetrahydromethanopterin S-methyltransferase subunit G